MFTRKKKISSEEITRLIRELATMLKAGIPLSKCLDTLKKQRNEQKNIREVLENIIHSISGGATLSQSLMQHTEAFDPLLIHMVRAGEASSSLPQVLQQIAGYREKQLKVKKKVKAAMTYPIIVMSVATVVVLSLLTFVVPRFQIIFDDVLNGEALPLATQILLNFSEHLQGFWIIYLCLGVLSAFYIKKALKNTKSKFLNERLILKTPKVGAVIKKLNILYISRALSTLLNGGVPLLESMRITTACANNSIISEALNNCTIALKQGHSLSSSLNAQKIFPPLVTNMVDAGEQTGSVAEMLHQVGNIYEEDLENSMTGLTALIEPLMIVLLAIVVGSVIIALFLPLIGLLDNIV